MYFLLRSSHFIFLSFLRGSLSSGSILNCNYCNSLPPIPQPAPLDSFDMYSFAFISSNVGLFFPTGSDDALPFFSSFLSLLLRYTLSLLLASVLSIFLIKSSFCSSPSSSFSFSCSYFKFALYLWLSSFPNIFFISSASSANASVFSAITVCLGL